MDGYVREYIIIDLPIMRFSKIENTFFTIINQVPELQDLIKKFGKITYHHTGSHRNIVLLSDIENYIFK